MIYHGPTIRQIAADAGILIKQDEDSHADFLDVFDFGEEFERMHTWGAAR